MAELTNTLKIPKHFYHYYSDVEADLPGIVPPAIVKQTERYYWISTIDDEDLEAFIAEAERWEEDYTYGFCNDNYTAGIGKGAVAVMRAYKAQILKEGEVK